MDHEGRVQRLRERFAEAGIDALYVSDLTNVRYLSGFTGSNGQLLVSSDRVRFFTDGRYTTQSAQEVKGADIEIYSSPAALTESLTSLVSDWGVKRIGFESSSVTVAALGDIESWAPETVPTKGLVEQLRRVKEPAEVERIREAAKLADAGLAHILERVEVGRTEREIALDLEFFMRQNGASDVSFDIIVAAGERSALPHAHPTDAVVEKGRYLLFDLGCVVDGYCSDLTRTVVVGPADDRHREIYELVLRSNEAGLSAVRAGASGADVDKAARKVIEDAGHADAFSHGLGHGVGLQIHEGPTLRWTSEDILEAGNVVTVEPGIYIEGWGGVRIEDLVVVTESGADILSATKKQLVTL